MRIALFSDTYLPEINGVATSTHILYEELKKHGHEVYVVTTRVGIGKCEWDGDVLRLAGIELKSLYGYVLTTPWHYNALNEIKKLKLDLIHVQTEFGVGIFARIAAKNLNVPLVSTYHTTYEDYTHYVNFINSKTIDDVAKKAVAKLSKLYGDSSIEVIAPSEKTKEMLLGYNVKRDIHVVPTGLDLDRFDTSNSSAEQVQTIRKEYGIGDDQKLIIFVGRIAEEKAIDFVINGFALVKKQNLNCKLLIIGGGPGEDDLKKLTTSLGLDDMVIFGGKKLSQEVPHYYHAADAFISASLTETQGMTFIEALASGLPVFARPDEVLNGLVEEGKTGYYFTTYEEMADKLAAFCKLDNTELKKMKTDCIEVVKPYSSEIFYERAYAVYEDAVREYNDQYTIDHIKTKDDYVQLFIESNSGEEIRLMISVDTYFDEGLRKGGKISEALLAKLTEEEKAVKAYRACVRKIAAHDRTRKEIYDFLTHDTECDIFYINKIVEDLETKGYIDDQKYTRAAVSSMMNSLQGENKIIRQLKKKGIPLETIKKALADNDSDNSELDNARKYAKKCQGQIRDKSLQLKKKLILQKMYTQGFDNDIAAQAVEELDMSEDNDKELENLKKAAQKCKKRYANKYEGTKLRNTMFKYLTSVGYKTEDVYAVLDGMKWSDINDN